MATTTPAGAAALDLDSLDLRKNADAGFALQLQHPTTGEPLPIWLQLLGRDSSAYQAKARAQQQAAFEKARRQGRNATVKLEDIQAQTLELLVVATVGWRTDGEVTLGGAPLPPFSAAAAREIYAHEGLSWIRDQADAAIADRANFTKASSAS
jgi:hypothetical protein